MWAGMTWNENKVPVAAAKNASHIYDTLKRSNNIKGLLFNTSLFPFDLDLKLGFLFQLFQTRHEKAILSILSLYLHPSILWNGRGPRYLFHTIKRDTTHILKAHSLHKDHKHVRPWGFDDSWLSWPLYDGLLCLIDPLSFSLCSLVITRP